MSVTWYLDDIQDQPDKKEDIAGNVKVRHHLVIQIHCLIKANLMPTVGDVFQTKSSITCSVGGIWKQYNPPGSGASSAFICVGDGGHPVSNPLDYVIRTQTWEYFGPWIDPPTGWGV